VVEVSVSKSSTAIALAIVLTNVAHDVKAQDWPTRAMTMIVPFAAGGPTDALGRILAPHLGDFLHQSIIVENVVGAGGMAGSARVAKATPDGYQFLLGGSNTHVYKQTLYSKPLYDAVTDFSPVAMVSRGAYVLVTRKDLPVATLPEFISYVRANQATLQFGSAGAGSATHLSCVMLDTAIGVNVTHVPYRGAGPALQDLMAGRIDYMCDAISTSLAQIKAGNIKPIAVLRPERIPVLSNVPSVAESGVGGLDTDGWTALFLPKATPLTIIQRLAQAASDALDTPALHQRWLDMGLRTPEPNERTPEYLTKLLPVDIERWRAPIRASGVLIE
jgi:tripartite-type tricarboxylate transporter receptor subunit TctC